MCAECTYGDTVSNFLASFEKPMKSLKYTAVNLTYTSQRRPESLYNPCTLTELFLLGTPVYVHTRAIFQSVGAIHKIMRASSFR